MALTDRNSYQPTDQIAVNILLSYEEDLQLWVAHCLELDIVEDGPTKVKALRHLLNVMESQMSVCLEDGMDFIQLAPEAYWRDWQHGTPCATGEDLDKAPHFHMAIRES